MRKNKLPYKLFTSPPSGPDFPACPHNREEVYKVLFTSIAGRLAEWNILRADFNQPVTQRYQFFLSCSQWLNCGGIIEVSSDVSTWTRTMQLLQSMFDPTSPLDPYLVDQLRQKSDGLWKEAFWGRALAGCRKLEGQNMNNSWLLRRRRYAGFEIHSTSLNILLTHDTSKHNNLNIYKEFYSTKMLIVCLVQ